MTKTPKTNEEGVVKKKTKKRKKRLPKVIPFFFHIRKVPRLGSKAFTAVLYIKMGLL